MQQNFRELIEAHGWTCAGLGRVLAGQNKDLRAAYRDFLWKGKATQAEIVQMSVAMGVSTQEIGLALEESRRRPGERDPRGRKAKASGGAIHGGTNAQERSGRAGYSALPAAVGAAR